MKGERGYGGKTVRALLVAFAASAAGMLAAEARLPSPTGMTVERLPSPIGIDAETPRLGWRLPDGFLWQSAYEIKTDSGTTGKVYGDSCVDVPWPGPPLVSSGRYDWRVRVWDENDRPSEWSDPCSFVMGVMSQKDWQALWIGPNRKTRDFDFGSAHWLGGVTNRICFSWNCETGVVELAWASTRPHRVFVNGKAVFASEGRLYDYRHLRFASIGPLLRQGRNEILFDLANCLRYDRRIVQSEPPDAVAVMARVGLEGNTLAQTGDGPGGMRLGRALEPAFAKSIDFRKELASPAFEKEFTVDRRVSRATLHVTGVGYYEAYLNGRRVGDKVLDPSPTDYGKRVLYSTYVLDREILVGTNVIKVLLGHGWWDVRSQAVWNFGEAPWRAFPRLVAQLELEYADGSRSVVATDGTWRHVASPVAFDCIREGEVIGGNEDRSRPFVGLPVEVVEGPKGILRSEAIPAARVVRTLGPSAIRRLGREQWLVSFPENLSGWVRLRLRGLRKGDVVSIRYDENISPDGLPTIPSNGMGIRNLSRRHRLIDIYFRQSGSYPFAAGEGAFQTDRFISSGQREEMYEPRFTYNGFRHVIVSGLAGELRPEDVEACAVQSDFATIGGFSCSDNTITRLVRMACNSYRVNFANGFPTDCAHREKLGWTGDGWMASEFAQFHFENTAAYEKWLQDIIDTQLPNGRICAIAPTDGWGYDEYAGPTFDLALAAVPWYLWAYRGDRKAMEMAYPAVMRLLAYYSKMETSPGLLETGLGDWNSAVREHMPTPEYTISCGYLHCKRLARAMAIALGKRSAAEELGMSAEQTRRAIVAKYYRGKGVFDNGRQTAQAHAVNLEIADPREREAVSEVLVSAVETTGCRLDIGLVGSKQIFRALSEIGRSDLACRLLVNREPPSMAAWLETETTLHEDFGLGLSKSHVMLGDFAAWAMQYLVGIRLPGTSLLSDPDVSGWSRIVIDPKTECGLEWARGHTVTPTGRLAVEWSRRSGIFMLKVEIPPASVAVVRMPNGECHEIGPGIRTFTVENNVSGK